MCFLKKSRYYFPAYVSPPLDPNYLDGIFCYCQIYEIGGGSGTCAKGIMDYVMLNAPPRVYNNMTYM